MLTRLRYSAGCVLALGCVACGSEPDATTVHHPSAVISAAEAKTDNADWGVFKTYFDDPTYSVREGLVGTAIIEPGQQIHPPHRHADEEYLMVTAGQGTWHLNGEDFAAVEGDILYAAPWDVHGITNTSDKMLSFVVFKWTPAGLPSPVDPTSGE